MKKEGKIVKALRDSPIDYWSDLFVAVMVVGWIAVIVIIVIFAIYAEIVFQDTSMWSNVENLVSIPLSCGGAVWMVKNAVQHAIANRNGKQAHKDFPKVDVEEMELEKEVTMPSDDEPEDI